MRIHATVENAAEIPNSTRSREVRKSFAVINALPANTVSARRFSLCPDAGDIMVVVRNMSSGRWWDLLLVGVLGCWSLGCGSGTLAGGVLIDAASACGDAFAPPV